MLLLLSPNHLRRRWRRRPGVENQNMELFLGSDPPKKVPTACTLFVDVYLLGATRRDLFPDSSGGMKDDNNVMID
jgi:hypothetical protein